MYLSRLYIENFRSIENVDLKFKKGKNVIVGKNNAGKSNIIKAIDLILGESSPTWKKSNNIVDNDFYKGETDRDIFIWCELTREDEIIDFSNIPGAFIKILENNSPYRISVTDFSSKQDMFFFGTEEGVSQLDDRVNSFSKQWIGDKPYCGGRTFNLQFNNIHKFAFAFRATKNGCEIIKEMMFFYKEDDSNDWMVGLTDRLRNQLIQSAIMPSFRDPSNQLRITNYNWYGKLLKEYIDSDNSQLETAFESVKIASNNLFESLKETVFSAETKIAFPNTNISFQFNPETKQDIYKSALIYVDDGFNSQLADKGAGIQSAVIIGLFDYYIRNVAHTNGSLLAIEEPEIYLHPHGRRVISDRLNSFLDNGNNQVIITTHSPEFICNPHEDINIISTKKSSHSTNASNCDFSDLKLKQILIKKQNAEMFFADVVILVEGADKYILESISEEIGAQINLQTSSGSKPLGKFWLNDYNVSIIDVGGKHEFWKYCCVLDSVKIPWLVVSDFDFFRNGLTEFMQKVYPQEDLSTLSDLKSRAGSLALGSYKRLSQITDADVNRDIGSYVETLKSKNLFLLSGELEDMYVIQPNWAKEGGVLETISKLIEENNPISHYVNTSEFVNSLKLIITNHLHLTIDS